MEGALSTLLLGLLLVFVNAIYRLCLCVDDLIRRRLPACCEGAVACVYLVVEHFCPRKRVNLNRIPKHLGVLFTDVETANERLILDFVEYCAIFDIRHVSFYDPWGSVHQKRVALKQAIEQRLRQSNHPSANAVLIDGAICSPSSSQIAPCSWTQVHFLCPQQDGRGALVLAARGLFERVKQGSLLPQQLTQQMISEQLMRQSSHCGSKDPLSQDALDPDFLVWFGPVDSLCGYPPWALRVTEMLMWPAQNSGGLSELQFVEFLEAFSARDRRLGK